MEPKKQNLKRQPVFADVVVAPREPGQLDLSREVRSQYMKLLYPNGVTLMLPVGVSPELALGDRLAVRRQSSNHSFD